MWCAVVTVWRAGGVRQVTGVVVLLHLVLKKGAFTGWAVGLTQRPRLVREEYWRRTPAQ